MRLPVQIWPNGGPVPAAAIPYLAQGNQGQDAVRRRVPRAHIFPAGVPFQTPKTCRWS
jgi:hypothetical protein